MLDAHQREAEALKDNEAALKKCVEDFVKTGTY